MSLDFYLIRHSKTDANNRENGIIMCGSTNVHLSDEGIELAKKVRKETDWSNSKRGLRSIKTIYVSELDRTYETAQAMFGDMIYDDELTQGRIPVIKHCEFNEVDFGDYEMCKKHSLPQHYLDLWKIKPSELTFPNGDNLQEVADKAYWRLMKLIDGGSPFIVISSCTTLRLLMTKLLNRSLSDFHYIPMENCQVYHIQYSNGVFRVMNGVNNE